MGEDSDFDSDLIKIAVVNAQTQTLYLFSARRKSLPLQAKKMDELGQPPMPPRSPHGFLFRWGKREESATGWSSTWNEIYSTIVRSMWGNGCGMGFVEHFF